MTLIDYESSDSVFDPELPELCKHLEELTRECDRIALEIVQRRTRIQSLVRIAQQSEALGEYDKFTSC